MAPASAAAFAVSGTGGANHLAGIDFAQSMVFASGDPELVLVGNRATLVKVNVVAPTPPATSAIWSGVADTSFWPIDACARS